MFRGKFNFASPKFSTWKKFASSSSSSSSFSTSKLFSLPATSFFFFLSAFSGYQLYHHSPSFAKFLPSSSSSSSSSSLLFFFSKTNNNKYQEENLVAMCSDDDKSNNKTKKFTTKELLERIQILANTVESQDLSPEQMEHVCHTLHVILGEYETLLMEQVQEQTKQNQKDGKTGSSSGKVKVDQHFPQALQESSFIFFQAGQYGEALELAKEALEMFELLHGGRIQEQQEQQQKEQKQKDTSHTLVIRGALDHKEIANALNSVASCYEVCNKPSKALEYIQKAYEMRVRLHENAKKKLSKSGSRGGEDSNNIRLLVPAAGTRGRNTGAGAGGQQQQQKQKEQDEDIVTASEIAATQCHLGSLLVDNGKKEEGFKLQREALKTKREIAKKLPEKSMEQLEATSELAFMLDAIGCSLEEKGDFHEALLKKKESLSLYRSLSEGQDSKDVVLALSSVSSCLENEGKFTEALGFRKEEIQMVKRLFGGDSSSSSSSRSSTNSTSANNLLLDHPHVVTTLYNYGTACARTQHNEDAVNAMREAVEMLKRVRGKENKSGNALSEDLQHLLFAVGNFLIETSHQPSVTPEQRKKWENEGNTFLSEANDMKKKIMKLMAQG